MERSFDDLGWLAERTQVRAEIVDPGFELKVIIPPATTLFDCQLGWVDPEGAMVITDIGGQHKPGWDPERGHGSVFKVHPDNRIEPIVPYGATGRAMIMSSMLSPADFGEYGERPFPLGQLRPGRAGAHNTHAVFWVPPDARWVEHFVIIPDAGSINGGKPGALVSPGFGPAGTPEAGSLYVIAMLNCVMYKVTSKREIWPFIIGDAEHSGIQFMPRYLYRAPANWGEHAGQLICEGVKNKSFATAANKPGEALPKEELVHFVVEDQGYGRLAKLSLISTQDYPPMPLPGSPNPGLSPDRFMGYEAPASFGPFAGHRFVADVGTANTMQTSTLDTDALPYDAAIYRIDPDGQRHLFIRKLQSGHPRIQFQGDRLLIGSIGKSYSTGDFHYPDGYLAEVVYTGR